MERIARREQKKNCTKCSFFFAKRLAQIKLLLFFCQDYNVIFVGEGDILRFGRIETNAKSLFGISKTYHWQTFYCPENSLNSYISTHNAGICFNPNAAQADAALTSCHAIIAQYGSILVSSLHTRQATILPPVHIVVADASQLVFSLSAALPTVDNINTASIWSIITGASRTADIEKTLVMGAHVPQSLHLILFSSR